MNLLPNRFWKKLNARVNNQTKELQTVLRQDYNINVVEILRNLGYSKSFPSKVTIQKTYTDDAKTVFRYTVIYRAFDNNSKKWDNLDFVFSTLFSRQLNEFTNLGIWLVGVGELGVWGGEDEMQDVATILAPLLKIQQLLTKELDTSFDSPLVFVWECNQYQNMGNYYILGDRSNKNQNQGYLGGQTVSLIDEYEFGDISQQPLLL